MRDQGPRGRDPSATDEWPILEDLSKFESMWRTGDRGSIERALAETDFDQIPGVLSLLIEAELRLRREAGERPSPAEYVARFPDHAPTIEAVFESQGDTWSRHASEERTSAGDAQVDRDATSLGPNPVDFSGSIDGESPTAPDPNARDRAWSDPRSAKDGCRYRILSYHDGGGLGEIYIAEDLELDRKVALKEIRERLASDPQARARFLLEAEVIGKLEHPGIVPIYGLGHYRDGRPYYAMRFIKGESLRKVIDAFHQGEARRTRGEHELMFRGLLGRFVDACNAIEYAHSRNVLHRDIKPGNIMLGRFGETLVVDWGLTKLLGEREEPDESSEGPLQSQASEAIEPTRLDSAVGTPRYMSPEQAACKADKVGPASDIFSLGATLYCILTGRPPFTGSDRDEVKDRACRGEFPPPREIRREIPAPLASICVKAMAVDPGQRYASARELADDVERWLADEPVSAHKYPAQARAARWVRRHRPLVAAAAALLVTLSIALAVSNVVIRAEERRAEANFKLASEAIDQMLVRVGDKSLMYVPRMNQLRSDLADDAVRFHKKLLDQHPRDPDLRWTYANNCIWAAHNHLMAGRFDKFFDYSGEIVSTYDILLNQDPSNRRYANAMIYAQIQEASALQRTGQIKAAIALLRKALVEAEKLAAADPESFKFRHTYTLARVRMNLCDALVMVGRHEEARVLYDAAIEKLEPVVREHPTVHVYRRSLVWLLVGRGILASETSDPARARQAFEAGSAQLDQLKAQGDEPVEVTALRAFLLNEKGRWLASTSRPAEAEGAHDEAFGLISGLFASYPDFVDYRIEGASALVYRGQLKAGLAEEKKRDAEEDLRRAIELLDPIVVAHPKMVRARSLLGRARGTLGRLLLERGEREPAGSLLAQAIDLQKGCLAENEASPRDQKALRDHEDALCRVKLGP